MGGGRGDAGGGGLAAMAPRVPGPGSGFRVGWRGFSATSVGEAFILAWGLGAGLLRCGV